MSIHIQKFIERVQGFEARAVKDFTMSMKDAKDLHADITRLLLTVNQLHEAVAAPSNNKISIIEIEGKPF